MICRKTGRAIKIVSIKLWVHQTTPKGKDNRMTTMQQNQRQRHFCLEDFHHTIWECACGEGHLAKVFEQYGHEVIATDLIYRGYGDPEPLDFLKDTLDDFEGDIITNPPYKYAVEFVRRALESVKLGRKVAMFLKLQFLEGKARKELFQSNPPKVVYVSSSRLLCAMNGEFDKITSSAVAYAWFVWEKGFTGETTIKWIN